MAVAHLTLGPPPLPLLSLLLLLHISDTGNTVNHTIKEDIQMEKEEEEE